MASQEEPDNIQVEVEREESPREQPPARARLHPNTCPVCTSHYREDELRDALRVCTVCGHHFPVGAEERVEQLADPGSFRRSQGPALGRSARLRRSAPVYRAAQRGGGRNRVSATR